MDNPPLVETGRLDPNHLPADHPDKQRELLIAFARAIDEVNHDCWMGRIQTSGSNGTVMCCKLADAAKAVLR